MTSVTSSLTPLMVVNSWATPSIFTELTAAPSRDESSTRRRALPNVCPNPRSRGSTSKRARLPASCSRVMLGICNCSNGPPVESSPRDSCCSGLLGVELDDELFLHRCVDLVALGSAQDLAGEVVVVDQQPRCDRRSKVGSGANGFGRLAAGPHGDDVVGTDLIRRDVDLAAVDTEVRVAHQLPCLATRSAKAETVHDVVEPHLEEAQQVLAGDALLAARHLVVVMKLLLEHLVVASCLLLLAQLEEVLALLDAATTVLPRGVHTALDGTLVGEATLSLEEELDRLTATLFALR